MITAWPAVIDKHSFPEISAFAERNSVLAKNLYNASLFRIRQVFTGWDKEVRSENERTVFAEIETAMAVYPKLNVRRVLTYNVLDKVLRVTKNPDFFAGLPMQSAQAVVRMACDDFRNWLRALKAYKEDPSRFLGRPRMPKYCKSMHKTFIVTNQDAVLYRDGDDRHAAVIKLPGIPRSRNVRISGLPSGNLRQVTVKPYYGRYILTYIFENAVPVFHPDLPEMAGLDLGVDNTAAIACTDSSSVICKGGVLLSWNRLFAKQKASAVSAITSGHAHVHAASKHLDNISFRHGCRVTDFLHKASTFVIRWCLMHRVGTLVIGVNRLWKQGIHMGKRNNQNFVSVPHARLRQMIAYKAITAGITVVEQEESYTSKADSTASDPIPVYGQEQGPVSFSGKRVRRGLYRTSKGYIINADCNGAANILRKAFPDAWTGVKEFCFLAAPEVIGFRKLNHYYKTA